MRPKNEWLTDSVYRALTRKHGEDATHDAIVEVLGITKSRPLPKDEALRAVRFRSKRRALDSVRAKRLCEPRFLGERSNRSAAERPVCGLEAEEKAKVTRLIVTQLAVELRRIVELRYFEGLEFQEISRCLRVPLKTVYDRHTRALAQIENNTLLRSVLS